jgi:hypothetical protein
MTRRSLSQAHDGSITGLLTLPSSSFSNLLNSLEACHVFALCGDSLALRVTTLRLTGLCAVCRLGGQGGTVGLA